MAPATLVDDHHLMSSNTVCVMDASGHLGSTLAQRLVQRGYTVHAALQSHGESKLGSVSCENNKRLKIFHLDPFDYQSIVDALKGCYGLFYTFEPPQDQPDYDEYMADVEVRAAHNVLEACARTETIDKVVFTSSVTVVVWRNGRSNNKSTAQNSDTRDPPPLLRHRLTVRPFHGVGLVSLCSPRHCELNGGLGSSRRRRWREKRRRESSAAPMTFSDSSHDDEQDRYL